MKNFVVEKSSDGQKAEKFIKKTLNEAPLGFIYKAFRKKDIKRNGHWIKKDDILYEGDVITVYVTDKQLEDFKKPREVSKKPFPYEVVYEDENVLIVNKPSGVLVYGDEKGTRETLGNAVLDYLYYKGEFDPNSASFIPSPAHRLDRNTYGLICYGKTDAALKELTELFKTRENIEKRYLALVVGKLEKKEGRIDIPLIKNEREGKVFACPIDKGGKTAITEYKVVKQKETVSLVEVDLITGRTHQIRAHFALIKHPLVGDDKYGDFSFNRQVKALTGLSSQFLVAYSLSFGTLNGTLKNLSNKTFKISLPKKLEEILTKLN